MNNINQKVDLLIIKDWELETYIGCLEHEKVKKQTLKIDLELEINNRLAAKSDNVEDCVEYTSLIKKLEKKFRDSHHNLIESLAENIAASVLEHHLALSVTVNLKKFGVLVSAEYAGVRICRSKS